MSEVIAVAIVKCKPGQEETLEAAVEELVAGSHTEEGNILYAVHRALQEPGTYVFVEKYASADAFKGHMSTPHFQAVAAKFGDLLAEPPVIVPAAPWVIGDPAKGAV